MICADAHHRRDADALTEKLWRYRIRMNQQRRDQARIDAIRTADRAHIPEFIRA